MGKKRPQITQALVLAGEHRGRNSPVSTLGCGSEREDLCREYRRSLWVHVWLWPRKLVRGGTQRGGLHVKNGVLEKSCLVA